VGFHAGAGARVRFSAHGFASIEARYTFGGAGVLQDRVDMDAVGVSAGLGYWF
jgi:hypothetical protein